MTPDGRVVFHQDFGQGAGEQIYIANLDGTGRSCITCSQPAPNMVPDVRPQGDKVLYHSWQGHQMTIGAPGFGGVGADVWVANLDGSNPVNLTQGTEGMDNYHAYWSPDGNRIVWAYLNWNFVTAGGEGKWDVRVADYVPTPTPHLANLRVVRPANGHYYETQRWKPDGTGFLYTESTGSALNLQLYFCELTGAADGCKVHQLTHDPSWDEQAVFTPDGTSVIFMSARGTPSFWNTWANASWTANLPADLDYLLILPMFEAGFLQPVGAATTDLYQVDPADPHLATRRVTNDGADGWITPEFTWDPTGKFLLWTELKYRDGVRTPIPFDATTQLQKVAAFLGHPPPPPDASTFDKGRPGQLLEARTRLGSFG
jgi:Tol biopolymer transport system component